MTTINWIPLPEHQGLRWDELGAGQSCSLPAPEQPVFVLYRDSAGTHIGFSRLFAKSTMFVEWHYVISLHEVPDDAVITHWAYIPNSYDLRKGANQP